MRVEVVRVSNHTFSSSDNRCSSVSTEDGELP